MSCRHNRLSYRIEAFISSISLSGRSANLPPLILSDIIVPVQKWFRAKAAVTTKLALAAALYTLTGAGAILAGPGTVEPEILNQAREGDMKRLIVHDQPRKVHEVEITDASGKSATIGDFSGSVVVLNFWATWCAPCIKEMPSLDRLQQSFDPADVTVVAVATGRNSVAKVENFLEENDIRSLMILYDRKTRLSGAMSVISIPVTVLIDRNGAEVARFIGDTTWDSDEAIKVIKILAETN